MRAARSRAREAERERHLWGYIEAIKCIDMYAHHNHNDATRSARMYSPVGSVWAISCQRNQKYVLIEIGCWRVNRMRATACLRPQRFSIRTLPTEPNYLPFYLPSTTVPSVGSFSAFDNPCICARAYTITSTYVKLAWTVREFKIEIHQFAIWNLFTFYAAVQTDCEFIIIIITFVVFSVETAIATSIQTVVSSVCQNGGVSISLANFAF